MALPFASGDPPSVGVEDDVAFVAAPAGSHAGQPRGGEGGVGSARLVRLAARVVRALALVVVASACTSSSTPPVTVTQPSETAVSPPTTTLSSDVNTSTTVTTEATAITDWAPSTTQVEPSVFSYAVVAEERAGRLAVLDPTDPCLSSADGCELTPVMTVDLSDRPHNLTGSGAFVYATHPAAGTISAVDIASGVAGMLECARAAEASTSAFRADAEGSERRARRRLTQLHARLPRLPLVREAGELLKRATTGVEDQIGNLIWSQSGAGRREVARIERKLAQLSRKIQELERTRRPRRARA